MDRNGPFGLWQGMQVEDFPGQLTEVAPYKFKTEFPPKPHSAFETYILQISPKSGLAWIKAIGFTLSTSVFGLELRGAFDAMDKKLFGIYGKSRKIDFLMSGSIWSGAQDWMQALQRKERILGSTWDRESGATLRDSLSSIFLGATAVDSDSGFISIEYSFFNLSQSEAEICEAEDGVL